MFKTLVTIAAAPLIVIGEALIGLGTVVTIGGLATKETGERKTIDWNGQADAAREAAAERKALRNAEAEARKAARLAAANARKMQAALLQRSVLEVRLRKQDELFQSFGLTLEAELV